VISVITPLKEVIHQGREPFFRKMMDTLSEQTYQEFEHIVVDGGSRDGTLEMLEEYRDRGFITTLISDRDNNLHEALNKGLDISKGQFIHVMNSDNYFADKHFFQKSLQALKTNQVDYTHADRLILKRDGSPSTIKKGDERVAFFRMPFRWQTMLIRREVYEEIGPFDEKYTIASDYKLRGYYFPEIFIVSLDGGITADRHLCIEEVSQVLYEVYGEKYGFTIQDCKNIYLQKISPELISKININIPEKMIVDSLNYCSSYRDAPQENFSRGLLCVSIPELDEPIRGKVRDNWVVKKGGSTFRVMVTTDRQWAFVRPVCTIPGKGQMSNQISAYWFERMRDIVKNHMIAVPHPNVLIAQQAYKTLPVEIVARRYLAKGNTPTSLSYNYFDRGRRDIYGIHFPGGLKTNQELSMGTIVTPTTKALDGHDNELTEAETSKIIGDLFGKEMWQHVKNISLLLFERAREEYLRMGLILADTKFEFGVDEEGSLILIDELLTPECSRIWKLDSYEQRMRDGLDPEPDKNFLVQWLNGKGFVGEGRVPIIEQNVVDELTGMHRLVYTKIFDQEIGSTNTSEDEIRKSILGFLNSGAD
jgi:phosphoribosylaminoimidazole-succinocarboxamide synthase